MAEAIEGIDETIRALKGMQDAVRPRIVRSAANAALTPGLQAVRNAAPRGTEPHRSYKGNPLAPGYLSRSARKSTKVGRDRQTVFGKITHKPEAHYGSFIEWGWRLGKRGADTVAASRIFRGGLSDTSTERLDARSGVSRTKIPGKPYFFPAIAAVEGQMDRIYFAKMADRIEKEFNKR